VAGSLVDMCLFSKWDVIVLSTDGWGWALTWAQLGVTFLRCYLLMRLAEEQLAKVVLVLASTINIVTISGIELAGDGSEVVSFHYGGGNLLDIIACGVATSYDSFVLHGLVGCKLFSLRSGYSILWC